MMNQLEDKLIKTFQDFCLTGDEKLDLRESLAMYEGDMEYLNFIRNKAFDIINDHVRKSQQIELPSLRWLEQVIKTIDVIRNRTNHIEQQTYFSPGLECKNTIIKLINCSKNYIDVCVFTISDNDIRDALLAAFNRQIKIRIITDDDKSFDMGSDVSMLKSKGIKVKKDNCSGHMHHKFAMIDGLYLINGSFNWTRSASKKNRENIVVSSDHELIKSFKNEFEDLWNEYSFK